MNENEATNTNTYAMQLKEYWEGNLELWHLYLNK